MIAFLRGAVLEKHPNQVIVDVGGVGYDLTIPVSTFTALPETGGEVRLRVHTHVREDQLALFGFWSARERELFERLIAVSGIGPRLAQVVLSGMAADDLIAALAAGDLARLTRIPGVGKKTAERMIVELRDKLQELAREVAPPATAAASDDEVPSTSSRTLIRSNRVYLLSATVRKNAAAFAGTCISAIM